MKPSQKTAGMEKALTGLFGWDRRSSIRANRCAPPPIGCGGVATSFTDALSEREFSISGLCQECQDSVFKEPEEEAEPEAPETKPPGPNDYLIIPRIGMKCGSAEAESRVYKKYVGKSGKIWLVAIQEAMAEDIYVHNPRDLNSQGFAGRTLTFPLEDGSVYEAKGPWHSNADGFYKDTGVDVRDTHFTFVVLAKERDSYPTIMRDVVYKDEKPVLGSFYRYRELAKQYPDATHYYSESSGGSSCGLIREEDRK